jgi:hypothetical protein
MFKGKTRPIELSDRTTRQFWRRVSRPDGANGCWEWTGMKDAAGYGFVSEYRAHRYAYTLLVGPIPENLVIDHLCRVTSCVNPTHLEPVPNGINVLRGFGPPASNSRKTHCCRGHDITQPGSYYVRPSRPRERRCRVCSLTERARKAAEVAA